MSEPTGPERVRAAIDRLRGAHAPTAPVVLCGEPDPDAMRADDPRWPGRPNGLDPWAEAVRPGDAVYPASVEGLRDECPDITDAEAEAILALGVLAPEGPFSLWDLITVRRAALAQPKENR